MTCLFALLVPFLFFQTNTLLANGDKNSLRKIVTEKMYSVCACCLSLFSWCHFSSIYVSIHSIIYAAFFLMQYSYIFEKYALCLNYLIDRNSRMKLSIESPCGIKFIGKWLSRWLRYEHCELDWQVSTFFINATV